MPINFFDYAYKELSHGAVLAYSLEAFCQHENNRRPTSAAAFGRRLVESCFPEQAHLSSDDVEVHREAHIGDTSHRPDFTLVATVEGTRYVSVIETKHTAPINKEQVDGYIDALRMSYNAAFAHAVLYKSTLSYRDLPDDNATLLQPNAIHTLLAKAQEEGRSTWVIDEYDRWIRKNVRRDQLFAEPAFHDWYLSDTPEHPTELQRYDDVWPGAPSRKDSGIRRRVYWHIVRHAARQVRNVDAEMVDHYVNSDGNKNDDSAWVHFKIADVPEGEGSIFFRLDHRTHGLGIEFRLYAGPKRGSNKPDETGQWKRIKEALLKHMRAELQKAGLGDAVDTPGYNAYRFQKGSKETSIACIWLAYAENQPPRGEGLSPSEMYEVFPSLYGCAVRAIFKTDELNTYLRWTVQPRE